MTRAATSSPSPLSAPLRRVLDAIVDRKGRAPCILEVTDLLGYTDHVVIVSARSERHAAGITDGIVEGLRELGLRPFGVDGRTDHRWSLLDYGDFIVHVFHHPVRLYYDLESMLHEAPRVPLDVPEELADTSDLPTRMPDAPPAPEFDLESGPYPADPFA